MPEVLAIVPASSPRQGVCVTPVSLAAGRTLLDHAIAAANASSLITRVVVATDDAQLAPQCTDVELLQTPPCSSDEQTALQVIDQLQARDGYQPDVVALLPWSAPLTTAADIDGTLAALDQQSADSALATSLLKGSLWQQGVPTGLAVATTEQQPQYLDAGAVYAMRTAGFRQATQRLFGTIAMHTLPAERTLQVRDACDLEVAAVRLRHRQAQQMDALLPENLGAIVFDFDGVFTDNLVTLDQNGVEAAVCSRGDGMGIGQLKKTGIPLLVLSKEPVPIVMRRCEKLGLECLHGVDHKLPLLDRWLADHGVTREQTVYMGNDINDIECLAAVGCGVVPADAHPDVLPVANLVLDFPGGRGAVRQLCDLVCRRGAIGLTRKAQPAQS